MAKTYNTISTFTSGQILTATQMNGIGTNVNNYRVPPMCRVYNSGALTIANNTLTALTFDSERFDTDAMHSTSTNTGRITFDTAGVYLLTAHVDWALNTTGNRQLFIRVGGSTYIAGQDADANASYSTAMSISTVYSFAAAQYAEVVVRQDSGVNVNVTAFAEESPEFSATWLGQVS